MSEVIGIFIPMAAGVAPKANRAFDWWDFVLKVGGVVGLIAGAYQLFDVARRRKYRRAEERALEILTAAVDADDAKADAARY